MPRHLQFACVRTLDSVKRNQVQHVAMPGGLPRPAYRVARCLPQLLTRFSTMGITTVCLLQVIPLEERGLGLGEAFNMRLDELKVVDIAFLGKCGGKGL